MIVVKIILRVWLKKAEPQTHLNTLEERIARSLKRLMHME